MTIGSRNHVFPIDLNSVRADEVGTLLTLASDPIAAQLDPPMPGDEVYALDEEGYQYVAVVADRDGIWLSLTIRWSTAIPPIDMKQRVGVQPFSIGRKTPTYSGRESG